MMFERVVCGVDPGPESQVAALQAARLTAEGGMLLLVGVVETEAAVHAGWAAGQVLEQLEKDSVEALEEARSGVAATIEPETLVVDGPSVPRFLEIVGREAAQLVVVGTHGHSRAGGIVLGSLSTTLLHEAPCPVLVARESAAGGGFPTRVVAATDGSEHSERAVATASEIAARFGAGLEVVAAGKDVDAEALRSVHPGVVIDERRAVEALTARSADADLLVLGSRGLHGLKALGSVSERVAHDARSSVLVVR